VTVPVRVDPATFRQIENAIFDLQSSDYNNFDKPIKKLARLLHSCELEPITSSLIAGINLDPWIDAGVATGRHMAGTAHLDWPAEPEKELGTIILLIDRFADKGARDAVDFAHTFYNNGSNINANLHNMTRQMLIPFARDYINYIKSKTGTVEATMLPARTEPAARKVFIVHGHDEGAREMVARYVQKLGFEPIILHEQASQGRTVIEKIDAHSDVGFAVVLLTPDDVGARKGEENKLQNRARQNVLLELGYFLGKLGRSRVCALKRGDTEVPSDFEGVVYVTFDEASGWKNDLGRELEAAGFEIDWNLAMRPAKH
jgi:predicted nucleotide-binding protein